MFLRTAVGAVGAAALVLTGAAPAIAGGDDDDHDYDEVSFRICKEVERYHHHHHDDDDDGHHDDELFEFRLKTDVDSERFEVEDGDCSKKITLSYDEARFSLKEFLDERRYKTPDFDVAKRSTETTDTHQNRARFVATWDEDEEDPYFKIRVTNYERKHHHHHHG